VVGSQASQWSLSTWPTAFSFSLLNDMHTSYSSFLAAITTTQLPSPMRLRNRCEASLDYTITAITTLPNKNSRDSAPFQEHSSCNTKPRNQALRTPQTTYCTAITFSSETILQMHWWNIQKKSPLLTNRTQFSIFTFHTICISVDSKLKNEDTDWKYEK